LPENIREFTMKFTGKLNSYHIIALGFLVALYMLWWGISNAGVYSSVPTPLTSHYVVSTDGNVQEMWSRSGTFLGTSHISLDAAGGVLFALGTLDPHKNLTVNAINEEDGNLIWHARYDGRPVTLSATRTNVYVGTLGGAQVRAYNIRTGENVWTKRFFSASAVEYLNTFDDKLYVRTSNDKFYVLQADNGKLTQDWDDDGWQSRVKYFSEGNEFTTNIIFEKRGNGLGYITAIDKNTEKPLWESDRNIISNVAATEDAVYFLTLDGKLVGLDARSGNMVATVIFAPSPFVLNSPNASTGRYFVAVDYNTKMLFAQIGDSYQLFAFKTE